MAEIVYDALDEHPLQEYLREADELNSVLPGGSAAFLNDLNPFRVNCTMAQVVRDLCRFARRFVSTSVFGLSFVMANRELAERLKYIVISSSLLSTTLSSHQLSRRSPGGRTPVLPYANSPSGDASRSTSPDAPATLSYFELTIVTAAGLALMQGNPPLTALCFLFMALVKSINDCEELAAPPRPSSLELTIASIEALTSAASFWESTVADAFAVLEKEDRGLANSSTGSRALPDTHIALRVSLNSSLHTTQSQCNNIRQLFAPLTSSTTLSQISEMYAPSVARPQSVLRSASTSPTITRQHSYAHMQQYSDRLASRSYESFSPSKPQVSRDWATWYAPVMSTGSSLPSSPVSAPGLKAKEKRRSGLPPLFLTGRGHQVASSDGVVSIALDSPSVSFLNADRLPLRRTSSERLQRPSSMRLEVDVPRIPLSTSRSPSPRVSGFASPASSSPSGSRFTTLRMSLQSHAHAHTLAALQQTLDATVASRRFTCAHLLALRFEEFEDARVELDGDFVVVPEARDDEAYWEDVRSIIDLLAIAFEDAASRLVEAVAESEQESSRVAQPSPPPPIDSLPSWARPEEDDLPRGRPLSFTQSLRDTFFSSGIPGSFAPTPSNMTRFAAHLDNALSSIESAKVLMQECVDALKAHQHVPGGTVSAEPAPLPKPLELYERLRRELGVALRECERGRGPLQTVLLPPLTATHDEDVPGSTLSSSADSSSSGGSLDSPPPPVAAFLPPVSLATDYHNATDETTAHLLYTSSIAHLPPPGIEQVFEAASTPVGAFARTRSTVPREERIARAKAARASGFPDKTKRDSLLSALGFSLSEDSETATARDESWGPSGDVVQELKDVIWQVGEKRRRMAERAAGGSLSLPSGAGARGILERWQDDQSAPAPAPASA